MKLDNVYLDMDGVLVEFTAAALRVHGKEQALLTWPLGHYSLPEALDMSPEDFWAPINALPPEWWENLSPTPWFEDLPRLVERWPITITSVPFTAVADIGKIAWMVKHYGSPPPRYEFIPQRPGLPTPGGHKANHFLLSKTAEERAGCLLIDDSDDEVQGWIAAGGPAIIVPAVWNSAYNSARAPMRYVIEQLQQYS